jgi:hypothetical protein
VAGGITTPPAPNVPGAPGTVAGGTGTLPTALAGGIGTPTEGEPGLKIEAMEPGSPPDRSGGLVIAFCKMLMHGTPPGLTVLSAAASEVIRGTDQNRPTAAIAVPAATRVVVRDIGSSPFLC